MKRKQQVAQVKIVKRVKLKAKAVLYDLTKWEKLPKKFHSLINPTYSVKNQKILY